MRKKRSIIITAALVILLLVGSASFLLINNKNREERCPVCQKGTLETTVQYAPWYWCGKERDCEEGRPDTKDYLMKRTVMTTVICSNEKCLSGNRTDSEEEELWSCGTKEVKKDIGTKTKGK